MTAINMPQVGQDIPIARVVEWLKQEGDPVRKGDVVATVESDKATFEVQADQAGMLVKISVLAGEQGAVFQPIAWIGLPEERGTGGAKGVVPAEEASSVLPDAATPHPCSDKEPCQRSFSTPSARRVASELGVDLSQVRGTGPGGRIQKEDVLAAAAMTKGTLVSHPITLPAASQVGPEATADGPTWDVVVPFSRMRQRIADRLTLSTQSIPHFYLFQEVDMTDAQQWRLARNTHTGNHLTVTDQVLFAMARALQEFPRLNSHVEKDRLTLRRQVNIGVATAVEDGLLVPVIPGAERKTIDELSRLSKELSDAARRGFVDPSIEGTFTVSSLGSYGIPAFLPILNPPECGILAVGAIQSRVVPLAGGMAVRQLMSLTLGCDHRAVDGAYAAQFLSRVKSLLETTWSAIKADATTQE